MLDAFKEFLDHMYWTGYAEEFQEDNPVAFYNQFRKFKDNQGFSL